MSKTLTRDSDITDRVIYTNIAGQDIVLIATHIDDKIRLQRNDRALPLEYQYKSPIHVDVNGAIVGVNPPWRLPESMHNKIFSIRDGKIIIREIVDFTEYYNDPNDTD